MSGKKGFGKVHVITGPGRGKTTAAFGLAMRAAGHGHKVCVIQFMKTGETTGEVLAAKKLGNIDVFQFGTGRFVNPKKVSDDDRQCAGEALKCARELLSKGVCSVLILDEVNPAISFGLIGVAEVLGLLRSRSEGIELVLTGRDAPKELVDYADYVSSIENLKHPFEEGLDARRGIEW